MHFLTLLDSDTDSLQRLIELTIKMGAGDVPADHRLDGKIVGHYFRGPSTRTRTAFATAAIRLGASNIHYGPADLQMTTGETASDTGHVLAQYLDALVVRTNGNDEELRSLAAQSSMSIINAMSSSEHPTQIIGDLATIKERTGSLQNRSIVYFGEGNNTAAALAYGVAMLPGMQLTLLTPFKYGLSADVLKRAQSLASSNGSMIVESHDIAHSMPTHADVVYTTRWETMGVVHQDPNWRESFLPFRVSRSYFDRLNRSGNTIFMHDLPAVRGQDTDADIIDGPSSVILQQARHKMSAAMAILGTFV